MDSGVGPWGRAAEAHFVVVVVFAAVVVWCGGASLSLTHSLSYPFFFLCFGPSGESTNGALPWLL